MRLNYLVEPPIRDRGILGAVVCEIQGIEIPGQASELEILKQEALAEILALDESFLQTEPVLTSYRTMVAAIGRSVRKFPPAAASLIELIRRNRRFPSINVAVDSYNITVCKRRLAIGAHDLDLVGPAITFRLSPGGEPFQAVGSASVKQTAPNDYVYADNARVLAWLDSRDADEVKLTPDSKNVLLVIQGTASTTRDYNRSAIEDAASRIVKFCGGTYEIREI